MPSETPKRAEIDASESAPKAGVQSTRLDTPIETVTLAAWYHSAEK